MSGSDIVMAPEVFRAWLDHMDWSERKAVERLGKSRMTIAGYLRDGVPLTTALACAALAAGLGPWKPEEDMGADWEERQALIDAAYAATSLADLFVAVNAYEDWHGRNRLEDDRVDELRPTWVRLPNFGGEEPGVEEIRRDGNGGQYRVRHFGPVDGREGQILSWDEKTVLVREDDGNWELKGR